MSPKRLRLSPHPRLYIGDKELTRLRRPSRHPKVQEAERTVEDLAQEYTRSPEVNWTPHTHNGHLVRARAMQTRVITLLAQYLRDGSPAYRDAVLAHVRAMRDWEYWSWIAWRAGDARPEAIFDLSYGENSATLALAYDLLHGELTPEEKQLFRETAVQRSFKPFLTVIREKRAWWFRKADTNWNTVCAGGAGMLALALYEDVPEAARVLALAEESVVPYMDELKQTDGGWPEGIGYWNYGFMYAFMYLLSYGRATGRLHPLLRHPTARKTLEFPLDFCPNGVPCSFGDVNQWTPRPFHFAAAEAMGCGGVLRALDDALRRRPTPRSPAARFTAGLLLFHPRTVRARNRQTRNVVKLYRGLDWAVLADRLPDPRLCMTIRGGTTEVPHGHMDLMSFHFVVGDESLASGVTNSEYLDSTFSSRRWELFEMTPPAKNTILVNGVGITRPSTVQTSVVRIGALQGVRIDATEAMGMSRSGPATQFCGRLYVLLGAEAALVVDRAQLRFAGRTESRMHSMAAVTALRRSARLKGSRQRAHVAYASTVPMVLQTAAGAPMTPGPATTMLRWITHDLTRDVTMATLLTPKGMGAVEIEQDGTALVIRVRAAGKTRLIRLTSKLWAVRRQPAGSKGR